MELLLFRDIPYLRAVGAAHGCAVGAGRLLIEHKKLFLKKTRPDSYRFCPSPPVLTSSPQICNFSFFLVLSFLLHLREEYRTMRKIPAVAPKPCAPTSHLCWFCKHFFFFFCFLTLAFVCVDHDSYGDDILYVLWC